MYIVIRQEKDDKPCTLCLVQARDSAEAKVMVGVPLSSQEWVHFSNELIEGLSQVKEGYIARKM